MGKRSAHSREKRKNKLSIEERQVLQNKELAASMLRQLKDIEILQESNKHG